MDIVQKSFQYSTKSIPAPSDKDYIIGLIDKAEMCLKRMRWKAFFFLNPNMSTANKENYGFKSRRTPPAIPALANFEDKVIKAIRNTKFHKNPCQFQKDLQRDIRYICDSDKLLVPADKTNNYYRISADDYNKLLHSNVTKSYKKVGNEPAREINNEDRNIAAKLELDDRISTTIEKEAFITLKDHKPNFLNNPSCRLINPRKSEIGRISKQLLDNINKSVLEHTKVNLWRNTGDTLDWFAKIGQKSEYRFVIFDIVEFYPSISAELMNKALDFASKYTPVSDNDRHIINHSKSSLLRYADEFWGKKANSNTFDVTMGSFDGAETCELIGIYILNLINVQIGHNFGLYRDDGLGILKGSPQTIERTKKQICALFKDLNLRITIEVNKTQVNFLDTTLNLTTGKHSPYTKPNNTNVYVHKASNHPPCILRNVPLAINRRLSSISSDVEEFDKAIPSYQQALYQAGYTHQLKYSPPTTQPTTHKRNRQRNIIWFNPPYNCNTQRSIGRTFLHLLDECFPKNSILHKIFNRNNVKVSYSCTDNIQKIINKHNKRITKKPSPIPQKTCNCRIKADCPMNGQCLTKGLIYQATVTTNQSERTYIGLTENTFKTRFSSHKHTFNNPDKRHATELSSHIWTLKDKGITFNLSWRIVKKASPCNTLSAKCHLCLWEKYFIIYKPSMASLNKRREMISTCRHSKKHKLQAIAPT